MADDRTGGQKETSPEKEAPEAGGNGRGYEAAAAELESLVTEIENPEISFGQVNEKLKRAMELVRYCRRELRSIEEDFQRTLNE